MHPERLSTDDRWSKSTGSSNPMALKRKPKRSISRENDGREEANGKLTSTTTRRLRKETANAPKKRFLCIACSEPYRRPMERAAHEEWDDRESNGPWPVVLEVNLRGHVSAQLTESLWACSAVGAWWVSRVSPNVFYFSLENFGDL
jgi:hypothetical protein